jgi:hypothetical protein
MIADHGPRFTKIWFRYFYRFPFHEGLAFITSYPGELPNLNFDIAFNFTLKQDSFFPDASASTA